MCLQGTLFHGKTNSELLFWLSGCRNYSNWNKQSDRNAKLISIRFSSHVCQEGCDFSLSSEPKNALSDKNVGPKNILNECYTKRITQFRGTLIRLGKNSFFQSYKEFLGFRPKQILKQCC